MNDHANLHPGISAAEWSIRGELAAFYRLLDHFGMTDLIDTHISVRVPGQKDQFLITRYGLLFSQITASRLGEINIRGEIIDPRKDIGDINQAGFNIHAAVHGARHDAHCVVHTHTDAGIAVSAQEQGLLPISQHALKYYRRLSYHDYEGIALDPEERPRLVRDLGDNKAMVLRNHGLLALGNSVAEAFNQIYFLERACQVQVKALAGGATLRIPSPEVCELTARQCEDEIENQLHELAWQAAKRLIDTQQADYAC